MPDTQPASGASASAANPELAYGQPIHLQVRTFCCAKGGNPSLTAAGVNSAVGHLAAQSN